MNYMINFLIQIKAKERTFHLATTIFDNFIGNKAVGDEFCNLLAISTLLIATKFEEIYPPSLNEIMIA